MLSKLLSKSECAKCRICCCFDDEDIWETPVITSQHMKEISQEFPQQKFIKKDDYYLLDMGEKESDKLYYCSTLDKSKGCTLGNKKPYDCQIWPFRVMTFQGKRVITLSPVCPAMQKKPLDQLQKLAQELSEDIFAHADKYPYMTKEFIIGYPILVVEE